MPAIAAGAVLSAVTSVAAPVPGQLTPVAIYHDTRSAFGLAYDTVNNLMWFSQGDSGDNLIHSFKPFNSYTPGQLAGIPQVGGVYQISPAQGNQDVAGTTTVTGPGGSGAGAHFSSLAFDSASGRIVYQSSAGLRAVTPITGAGDAPFAAPPPNSGFTDGLDVDGGNVWWSPDVGPIYRNGAIFATGASAGAQGAPPTSGFSGVEQVGNAVFAVAVGSYGGHERTIFKFDATTGDLLGYDPDGDPVAARWEDLAFDGRYLYAADLRGNANGTGAVGDIYVFDTGGGIVIEPPGGVPEAGSTWILLSLAMGSLFGIRRLRKG